MAAPTKRGSTSPVSGLSTTSPAGTAIGDLVVVITGERAGAGVPTHTLQSGFTEIRSHSHDDGSTDGRLSVCAKVATVAGAQAYQGYTTSGSGTVYTGCIVFTIATYRGLASLPASNSSTQTTNAVPDPPSLTNLTGDFTFLNIAFWHLGAAGTNAVAPGANYTEEWELAGSSDSDLGLALRDRTALAAATEDPPAWTDAIAPNGTCSMTIAVQGATPLTRSTALDAATTCDVIASRVRTRSTALDAATTLDVIASRISVARRATALDAATTVDVLAARVRTRVTALDAATTLDIAAPQRTLHRATAIDGATSIDIVAARAVLRSIVIDATTTLDMVATRALLRAAAIDGASSVDVAAARVLLRAIVIDASTALDVLAARVLMRSTAVDGATSVDVAAARAIVRAIALTATTTFDVIATRAVLRSIGLDAETDVQIDGSIPNQSQTYQRSASFDASTAVDALAARVVQRVAALSADSSVDIAAVRALVRAAAFDALTSVDIAATVPPRTVQRSAVFDAETLLAIVAVRLGSWVAEVIDNRPVILCTVTQTDQYSCTITRTS